MDNIYQKILWGQRVTNQTTKQVAINFRGIGYTRVSSTGQIKEGNGLDSQKRACADCAKRMEIPLVHYFSDEAVSGRKLERQGIYQAIEYIKQNQNTDHPITHIFTTECSRLSRSKNLYDTLDLEREIQKYGAKIVFVNMSALNNEDSGSQLLKTVSYYAASQESERISERTVTGMKNRVLEGYRPFQRPLGYKSLKILLPSGKEDVLMQRDEPMASVLAEGLEKFASGELFTKAQLFHFLKDRGVRTSVAEKQGKGLIDSIIERILNPQRLIVYAGYVLCPTRGINELIPGKHAPLISLETAKTISRRLSGEENQPVIVRKDFNEHVPLRGIVYCGECGMKLTGGQSRGKLGKYYSYYQCCCRSCPQKGKTIRVAQLHSDVREALFQRKTDEHIDKLFDYIFNEVLESNYSTLDTAYKEKEYEIKTIENEIENTLQKIMTLSNYDILRKLEESVEKLTQRKNLLNMEIQEKDDKTFDVSGLYEELQFLFKNADKIRDIADQELRHILVGVRYNGKIEYKKNQGVLNPDFSLSYALFEVLSSIFLKWGG